MHTCLATCRYPSRLATTSLRTTHQHSPMFGHLASSHTVCRLSSRSLDLMSTYLSPPGTLLFSQSGFRVFSCAGRHWCWPWTGLTFCHAFARSQGLRTSGAVRLTFQCGAATEYPLGRLLLGSERKSSRAGPAQSAAFSGLTHPRIKSRRITGRNWQSV